MKEEFPGKDSTTKQRWWVVMGLAMGLPSLIIGLFFLLYYLKKENIIGWEVVLGILLLAIGNTFYWMIRYGFKK